MCLFCGSPEPLHLGWVPLALGAYGYYKGKQAIRRAERERQAEAEPVAARPGPRQPQDRSEDVRMVAEKSVDVTFLKEYLDAWNRHDVDTLMDHMADDCVFETPSPAPNGTRYEGRDAVRQGFQHVFDMIPDVQFVKDHHFVAGEQAVSEWTLIGTHRKRGRIEARGCDLFTLRGDKIVEKRSYMKMF